MRRSHNENQTRRHRLLGHDYTEAGYYFVTFGTKDGQELLGIINEGRMSLSETGQIISDLIKELPNQFDQVIVDSLAIMPNHVHILMYLKIDHEPVSISDLVRLIKGRSSATHRKLGLNSNGLWQKGFHDEIVRNDKQLDEVRRYIAENPIRWRKNEGW